MFNKVWNNNVKGVFLAGFLFLKIIFEKTRSKVSTFLFKTGVAKCGSMPNLLGDVNLRYPGLIYVGARFVLGRGTSLSTENIAPNRFIAGDDVTIGNNCAIDFTGGITIHDEAHVAHNVLVLTHDHGYDYKAKPVGKSLEIGQHAFVGSRSVILHNCNYIGKYAVIGVGSIVTKDVPDYAIVAGNPAKIIGSIKNETLNVDNIKKKYEDSVI